jgi:hypothetical protein
MRDSPPVPSIESEDKRSKRRNGPGVLSVLLVGIVVLIAISAALATDVRYRG